VRAIFLAGAILAAIAAARAAQTVVAVAARSPAATAQSAGGVSLDHAVPPGNNYDKAEFRLWYPNGPGPVVAVLVLVPGSNGDGRPMAQDPFWQEFAARQRLAIVACRLTDKPHDQSFIEEYVNVSRGSGQALVDALSAFASRSNHAELAAAPLLLWGMSAGGEFNYEFVAWKPERVVAFVVNKGGIYYTALAPRASREVPGLLFVGEKDLEFRTHTIAGLFAVNRRAGALWALTEEPGAAHVVGRSRDLGVMFFEDVLPLRLGRAAAGTTGTDGLAALSERSGFIGDVKAHTVQPMADAAAPSVPTAWLPTLRIARAWEAVVAGKPF